MCVKEAIHGKKNSIITLILMVNFAKVTPALLRDRSTEEEDLLLMSKRKVREKEEGTLMVTEKEEGDSMETDKSCR